MELLRDGTPGKRRKPLTGRRVLITGGSSGIGLATAERLGRAGAAVVLLARGEGGLEEAARSVPGCRGTIAADATDAEQIVRAAGQAAELLGGLDAAVVNAAAAAYGPFLEMREEDYRETIESALLGPLNTARAVLPHLAEHGGTLVFVGSVAARVPVPWLAPYAAAKHGVRGFARSLAGELRALDVPVAVRLVHPGPIDTPFWERARTTDRRLPPKLAGVYRPEDVATEIERALTGARALERTVGGLMAVWERFDALVPNLAVRIVAAGARLGWRRRGGRPVSHADGLSQPSTQAVKSGGLPSRPSALTWLRD